MKPQKSCILFYGKEGEIGLPGKLGSRLKEKFWKDLSTEHQDITKADFEAIVDSALKPSPTIPTSLTDKLLALGIPFDVVTRLNPDTREHFSQMLLFEVFRTEPGSTIDMMVMTEGNKGFYCEDFTFPLLGLTAEAIAFNARVAINAGDSDKLADALIDNMLVSILANLSPDMKGATVSAISRKLGAKVDERTSAQELRQHALFSDGTSIDKSVLGPLGQSVVGALRRNSRLEAMDLSQKELGALLDVGRGQKSSAPLSQKLLAYGIPEEVIDRLNPDFTPYFRHENLFEVYLKEPGSRLKTMTVLHGRDMHCEQSFFSEEVSVPQMADSYGRTLAMAVREARNGDSQQVADICYHELLEGILNGIDADTSEEVKERLSRMIYTQPLSQTPDKSELPNLMNW